MSQRTAFFDSLTEELPDDVWGLRLQEELAAHLDDAVYFGALEGKTETLAEEQALADLGSPTLILQEFRHAMTYKSLSAFFLHAAAVGFLAAPLVYLGSLLAHAPATLIPFTALLYAYFAFALAPVMRHIEGRRLRVNLALIASGIPVLLVCLPMMFAAFNVQIMSGDRPFLLASFIVAAFVTIGTALLAAWKPIDAQQSTAAKNAGIVVVLATLFLIASTSSYNGQPMNALEKTRYLLSSMLATPNSFADILDPVTAAWISGLIATGAGMIALVFTIKGIVRKTQNRKETLPWIWGLIALFTLSLVLFPGKAPGIQNITWTDIPHTNISEIIERDQLGPFYGMAKYMNQGSMNSFSYFVSVEDGVPENGFFVKQSLGNVFALSDLVSINDFTLTKDREEEISGAVMSVPEIWCHQKAIPGVLVQTGNENGDVFTDDLEGDVGYLANTSPLYCYDLYVGDKKIFDAPEGIDIGNNITLNDDATWMLFMHDTDRELMGTLSPTEVYLIDLR